MTLNLAERSYKGGPRIPVEPFIQWCEMKLVQYGGPQALKASINCDGRFASDATGARDRLARKLGIASRTLWRYTHWVDSCGRPTTVAPRWPVEDMLTRAGVDFYSVYNEARLASYGISGAVALTLPRDGFSLSAVRQFVDVTANCLALATERDIELEADAWCRCCREFVTPIFGLCPWDDTPVHMEMAA